MLTKKCIEVAVEALVLKEDVEVRVIKDVNKPVFFVSGGKIFLVAPENVPPETPVSKVAIEVPILSPQEKLYEAARKMTEAGVKILPVIAGGEKILAVTSKQIISALEDTKELAKREARVVMSPVAVIRESRAHNAENIAFKSGIPVVPLVNEAGKLIAAWYNGKIMKRVPVVKETTRVKLVCRKLEKNPFVIVVDKQREPKGIIRDDELLTLAASFREVTAPVFYTGVEILEALDLADLKAMINDTLLKIARIVPVHYAAVRISKRGVWKVNIRVSTRWRMFLAAREGEDLLPVVRDALDAVMEQVRREKEERLKLRGV